MMVSGNGLVRIVKKTKDLLGVGNTTLGTFYNLQAMVPLTLDVMRAGGASTSMARRVLSMIV